MKQLKVFAILLVIGARSTSAVADDPIADLYFAEEANGKPAIVDTRTGEKSYVAKAVNGSAPSDCPKNSYWIKDSTVVRCVDGVRFKLVPIDKDMAAPAGALMLSPVPGHSQGTDDPGPSKHDSTGKKATP